MGVQDFLVTYGTLWERYSCDMEGTLYSKINCGWLILRSLTSFLFNASNSISFLRSASTLVTISGRCLPIPITSTVTVSPNLLIAKETLIIIKHWQDRKKKMSEVLAVLKRAILKPRFREVSRSRDKSMYIRNITMQNSQSGMY